MAELSASTQHVAPPKGPESKDVAVTEVAVSQSPKDKDSETNSVTEENDKPPPPWQWKLIAVILVTLIRFGGAWGAGLNTSMKVALKKELQIDNTKYALLNSCEDFVKSALIIFTGALTDRLGGAATLFYGNIIYSVGSLLIAAAVEVKSFDFMMAASVIMSFGDLSTQIAQFQVFSSWFAPGNGFASTLGFEIMINKCGALAGAGSSNQIAIATGKLSWVYWIAFFVNLFTNVCCAVFYWFTYKSRGKYGRVRDPATGVQLREKSKKFNLKKIFELPWTFWLVLCFSLFTTSTSVIFNANATEFAEHRFNVPATKAGWYVAVMKYGGFAIIPAVSIFSDFFGQRISFMVFNGLGVFTAMALVNWGDKISGTAAAFGVFAVSTIYSPAVIIDSIRTVLPEQTTFGLAYSLKVLMSNSINIVVAIGAGVLQDRSNNSYDEVVKMYMAMSCASVCVCIGMVVATRFSVDWRSLQWSRKQRIARGHILLDRIETFYTTRYARNRKISIGCFSFLMTLMLGGWAAFFWGAGTKNMY